MVGEALRRRINKKNKHEFSFTLDKEIKIIYEKCIWEVFMSSTNLVDTLPFSTKRLVIRRYSLDDRQDYFEIFGNPNISKYDEFDPIDLPTATINIQEILDWYENGSPEQSYAVELPTAKKAIGCLYHKANKNGDIFIGYHFNEAFHGNGYAAESVAAYTYWLLEQTSGNVMAISDPENISSINLLKKIGFEFVKNKVTKNKDNQVIKESIFRFKKPT